MSTEDKYSLILNYAGGIPKDLLTIFMPSTPEGLEKLEANLLAKALNRPSKQAARILRKQHQKDLPLCSRRWSLRYLKIRIAIIALKKRMKNGWKDNNGGSDV